MAYSGIIHMGMDIMMLGLFSKEYIEPTLLYIFIYVIGFLGIVLLMEFYKNEKFCYLYDISGLHQLNIAMAISWSLYILLAGEYHLYQDF